ncbi:gliding motility-associated C-terminal domain-containing protein [Pontibacter sp. KCTC 32443]|uniref:LamG-like jellyroll fold domain-containing protein n=1 Tax=Pontibacter TaxID=323449 RepID=UPI00164E0E96|nr:MULTISPECIES: LamG-like jellyroll fold domain-containing protein [Pontibacter]MBC5773614.1 gliding motility-associated C-terminal domain-containing protein [Pontibacter sp. KCTC 32443]
MKTLILLSVTLLFLIFSTKTSQAQGSRNALQFDGYDDYLFFDTNNRGITNEVTVEAWVKTTATKLQLVTAKYDRDAEHGYQLVMNQGQAAFSGRDGSGEYRISGYSPKIINDNQWHHLAGVCKNGTWSIYIDGILENQSVTGYAFVDLRSNAPFTVGNYYMVNRDFFNGQVDELKIWKKGKSVEEIRAGMCQTANLSSSDLVVYLKFDEGNGSTIQDLSPTKISGTFRNMIPASAWVISGAPIGDKSTYLYPALWSGQQFDLASTGGNRIAVTSTDPTLKGMHIYSVESPPASNTGIDYPAQVNDYFGVFKVGNASSGYKVTAYQVNAECNRNIFKRDNNTITSWAKIASAQSPSFPFFNSTASQNEVALTTYISGSITIQSSGDFCSGSNGTLSVNTNGTVLWSTGEVTKSISITTGGTYSVTVTENGCTSVGTISVNAVNPPIVNLGPDRTICEGETAVLEATAGAFTYKWSTGATTRSIYTSTEGTYWVQVTNTTGCTTTDEINIKVNPKPVVSLPTNHEICPGESVTLDATVPLAQYSWSTGATTAAIPVSVPGNYWVDVTLNGCKVRLNTSVTYKAQQTFTISGALTFCEGTTTTLSVPDIGNILWSNGATTPSITVADGGTYSAQTIVNGCTLTSQVQVAKISKPVFSLGDDKTICAGEKVNLNAPINMGSYRWNTGETTSSIEVSESGAYWVEITSKGGCTYRDEINITVKSEPDFTLPAEVNTCYGEYVTIDATTANAATYLWNNGKTTASISVTAPADLEVTITIGGCDYVRKIKVSADECPIIPNIITPNRDGKNDTFVLQGINIDNIEIEIFNRWGKSIYKRTGYDNMWDADGANAGIYYYHLKSRQTNKDYKGWVEIIK